MNLQTLQRLIIPALPKLACPRCGSAFSLAGTSLKCANNHCYDLCAKGYVNLAPQHDQSKEKYDAALFESRNRILTDGFYQPVLDVLARKAKEGLDVRMLIDGTCEFTTLTHDYPERLQALGIQCLSQREYDVTNFGRKKIIATNGVSIPELRKTSFRKTGLKLVFVGRLDAYHKGLDILLEAVRNIKDKMKETGATLDIYGPDYAGRYAHIESLIAENNVGDVVTLHPAVSGKEKEQILLDSDVFVQTSRFEGMPLGILESLSYGLPCLVTRGTTLGEQIAESGSGWMAETNADSITGQLSKVLDEASTLPEKSDKSIEFVKQNYSWDVIAKKTVDLYSELAGYSK